METTRATATCEDCPSNEGCLLFTDAVVPPSSGIVRLRENVGYEMDGNGFLSLGSNTAKWGLIMFTSCLLVSAV